MWETIQGVLTSDNFFKTVIGIGILVILLAILAKKGLFSFKGKGLTIDNGKDSERETERAIIRSQMMFVKTEISDFYNKVPNWEDRDEYRLKYIIEKCQDIFYEAISINHIVIEPVYLEIKQKTVWAEVLQNAENPNVINEDFKKVVYDETKYILSKLIEIRDYYKKDKN